MNCDLCELQYNIFFVFLFTDFTGTWIATVPEATRIYYPNAERIVEGRAGIREGREGDSHDRASSLTILMGRERARGRGEARGSA